MPKVPIWLISYNHGKFIEKSIQSVLEQTYMDYGPLIIDGDGNDYNGDVHVYNYMVEVG